MSESLPFEYDALARHAGLSTLPRSQVALGGKDRARLLHGLCTNDIKRLVPGQGCEAFLTDPQGHTVGYIDVFCRTDELCVDSTAGAGPEIIRMLDRYVVREDVRFTDCSEMGPELLVAGPAAPGALQRLLGVELDAAWGSHRDVMLADRRVSIRRTTYAGPHCFQISAEAAVREQLAADLESLGVVRCSAATLDVLRIEQATPVFGQDVTADNLPQEVDRDEQAISFTKGCYIGQETVARIDSLGHVNRILRRLRFTGQEVPPPGGEILRDGKMVARVTSACRSPRFQGPVALAYVRRGSHVPGTRLASTWGEAEVLAARL
ncbi:MAG: folate-binding protein YgfZ [Pirellulaceae bacterium]